MIPNIKWPHTRKIVSTEKVILYSLEMYGKQWMLENMLYMNLIELLSILKSLVFIQLHQSHSVYYTVICLSFSVFSVSSFHHASFTAHTLMFDANIPSFILIFHSVPSSVHHFRIIDCHFGRDLLPCSCSPATAIPHWFSLLSQWCQNMAPC
jgi:hypothetical protein